MADPERQHPAAAPRRPGPIVLVGFMGCGKSTTGRALAQRVGYRLIDTDQIVSRTVGLPISEIFASRGEGFFRDAETEALRSLADRPNLVIATGGGAILREENRDIMRSLGFVAWLHASEEVIFERVSRNDRRPLLRTDNPRETVRRLLAERTPLYRSVAHFDLDTSTLSHAQAASAILEAASAWWANP